MSIADELEKLNKLRIDGAISEEEYRESKEALLKKQNNISFGAGIIVPIVLWLMKKNDSEVIDEHGCNVVNWMISAFIYALVFGLLSVLLIGIPLLIILCIVAIIFPIVGAVKANDGEVWRYPFTITFITPRMG